MHLHLFIPNSRENKWIRALAKQHRWISRTKYWAIYATWFHLYKFAKHHNQIIYCSEILGDAAKSVKMAINYRKCKTVITIKAERKRQDHRGT